MKPICLVIGAGAGIGGNVGKRFAEAGYHAVLCRRTNADGLRQLVEEIEIKGGSASGFLLNAVETSSLEDQVGYQDKVMRVELDAVPTELGSTEPDTEIIDGEGKSGGDEASGGEAKATKKWWEFWK